MIKVIAVGKLKEKATQALVDEYMKRLQTVHKLEIIELGKSKHKDSEVQKIIEDEGERILAKLSPSDYLMLLDLKGENLSSESLSQKMDLILNQGQTLVFVIGGSHGVSQAVKSRAQAKWQLSNLTFPHQLVRILLLEQVYRSFMIMKGHPYHK